MSAGSRPPRIARWLLRFQPLGERRAEIESDLLEHLQNFFVARTQMTAEKGIRRS